MGIDKNGSETTVWDVSSWVWVSAEGRQVAKLLFIPCLLRNSVNTPTCGHRGLFFFFKPFDRRQRKKIRLLILFFERDDHTGGRGTLKANSTSATWGHEAPTCCPAWRPS